MSITIRLNGHAEKIAPEGSYQETFAYPPLYHQIRTREALCDYHVVVNTYNTGTGKTRASLLHLFDMGARQNVLFIAPTNALIDQHVDTIRAFVSEHNLDFHITPVTADTVRALRGDLRPGEALSRLLRNPLEFDPANRHSRPMIIVTNPDIFYYAMYYHYGPHDQRNVFGEFVRRFDYVVVDEFHYYNNKQLINFLFAFALFKEWGYFEYAGRRVCLLSATPRENVLKYLYELFGDEGLCLVTPDNEPPESDDYPTIPTLAPLCLTIENGWLTDWLEGGAGTVSGWINDDGLDGAVISNSLARINVAYGQLARPVPSIGRITGPEPTEARASATAKKLILATPTVDIGYNFEKHNKAQRQNIDFVVTEARFEDEMVQRIGRAGRVLGKAHSDIPSHAVVLVSSEDALSALQELDGQTLSRSDFARRLRETGALSVKHQLEAYIRRYAIQELCYPIYKIRQTLPDQEQLDELDAFYGRLCELFAPNWNYPAGRWIYAFRKQDEQERWLRAARTAKLSQPPKGTVVQVADWFAWQNQNSERYDPSVFHPKLRQIWLRDKAELIAFVQGQVELGKALFSFRDSFQGPTAVFYDPQRWFSSRRVNSYDLFHLLGHYHLSAPMKNIQLSERAGEDVPAGDFYLELLSPRDASLIVAFTLSTDLSRDVFDKRWARLPVALTGLQIQVWERGGDPVAGGVHYELAAALADTPVVCMVLPGEDFPVVKKQFDGTEIMKRRLTVNFGDGEQRDDYMLFAGLAAFEAHAELEGYFRRLDRLRPDAIII